MKKLDGLVYRATSPSGKTYIGITITSVKERKRLHEKAAWKGSQFPFHAAIRKYGVDKISWEIIDRATTWEKLCELERRYISQYDSKSSGYNVALGGEGTYGVKHNDEWRAANSRRRRAYFQDPANKRKQSIANKKAHVQNPRQAKQHSAFMKKRFTKSEERRTIAEGMKDFLSNPKNRRVHSIQRGARPFLVGKYGNTVGEWLTQWQCARDLGLNVSHINACLHGVRKSHSGFTFRYKAELADAVVAKTLSPSARGQQESQIDLRIAFSPDNTGNGKNKSWTRKFPANQTEHRTAAGHGASPCALVGEDRIVC